MIAVFLLTFIPVKLFLHTQGQNIHHAKIYSENKAVPEGGNLEVTCSTFGYTAKSVYVYLCKNGTALDMKKQCNQDVTFRMERIGKNHSGNYSCVFSEEHLETTKVMGYGDNYIFINVIDSFIPAQIHLVKSEVSEGSDAEFTCTTNPLNIKQPKNMILAFLIKNRMTIKVNIWDTKSAMTTFTLRKVGMEDAGTYSCVVLLNTLYHPEMRLHGNNEVNLQITESFIPGQIHLLKSAVLEGSNAEFTCTTSNPLNINQTGLVFLIRNRMTIKVNIWGTKATMTTFTLRKVGMEDAGTYSCVVLLNTLYHPEMRLYGNNEVTLRITVVSYSRTRKVRIVIVCLSLLLFLSLLLGILAMILKQGFFGCYNERSLDEEQFRGTEVIHEETSPAEAEEIQSVCSVSEWDEFTDSEEDARLSVMSS